MGANHTPINDVYIDESSQNGHRYLVMGGIIIPTQDATAFTTRIIDARLPELPQGEMKWTKVSRSKLAAYKRVIDLFFAPEYAKMAHFHSAVVDTTKQNNRAFNDGSREIGFSKELFQLSRKFARIYGGKFHVYPDERKTSQRLDDLRLMLNRHVHKTHPERDWPYRRVQFRDSAKTPLLQLTDIMTGAIAFGLNGHHKIDGASPAKCELMRYVLEHAKIKDVHAGTATRGKFTIWHRQLRMVS